MSKGEKMGRKLSELWANFTTDEEWFTYGSCTFFLSTDLNVVYESVQNKTFEVNKWELQYFGIFLWNINLDSKR